MLWTSIDHAHEYWRSQRQIADPPTDLEDTETFILGQRPRSVQDAICMLDIVCAYPGDARCDGLDHIALERIRDFLSLAANDLPDRFIA